MTPGSVGGMPSTSKPQSPDEAGAFYGQFVRAGDLCFDIGAHWGGCTAALRTLYAEVICVEPQPRIVHALERRFANDAFVHIVPKGAAAREGHLPMFISEHDSTISTFAEKWKTGRFQDCTDWNITQNIPVTTLDALIKQYGTPRFCKIDVEGFEYEVLQGLSTPIPTLSFEFTREFLGDAELCMWHLASLGDAEFNYCLAATMQWGLQRWAQAQDVLACLQSSEDDSLWGDIYVRYNC